MLIKHRLRKYAWMVCITATSALLYLHLDGALQLRGLEGQPGRITVSVVQPHEQQHEVGVEEEWTTQGHGWMAKVKEGKRPNVLFIVADDMRPDINAYRNRQSPWVEPSIFTPNLDRLARGGIVFRRAYCQMSLCNPSRTSLLTSRRPDTTMVHNNTVFFRSLNPDFVTLPQYFKANGYLTLGMGKIFHLMGLGNDFDEPLSWSARMTRLDRSKLVSEEGRGWKAVTLKDRENNLLLQDEAVTENAKRTLERIAKKQKTTNKPFFLAVGLKKPHFNLYFPDLFIDNYLVDEMSMPVNPLMSRSTPDIAWYNESDVLKFEEYMAEVQNWNISKSLSSRVTAELRRAYYSCITYIDDLVGQLLHQLHDVGLAENTIVSFLGDHGFHLGEQNMFGKNTAFEVANNVPMIIRVPGVTDDGILSDDLVELVDLFPTLVDLAGLPRLSYCPEGAESRQARVCTEGTSLLPLLRGQGVDAWKDRVFFQSIHTDAREDRFCMGYSVRSKRYRYTEWVDFDYTRAVPADWTSLCGVEMYDHHSDPHETINIADDVDMKIIREDLSGKLRAGWKSALK